MANFLKWLGKKKKEKKVPIIEPLMKDELNVGIDGLNKALIIKRQLKSTLKIQKTFLKNANSTGARI
jgi:hypothetical protein